jgi:hypothetical protein
MTEVEGSFETNEHEVLVTGKVLQQREIVR